MGTRRPAGGSGGGSNDRSGGVRTGSQSGKTGGEGKSGAGGRGGGGGMMGGGGGRGGDSGRASGGNASDNTSIGNINISS